MPLVFVFFLKSFFSYCDAWLWSCGRNLLNSSSVTHKGRGKRVVKFRTSKMIDDSVEFVSDYYWCATSTTVTRAVRERKLRQGQNVDRKWSGTLVRISRLILIRMSTGSLPKCCGFITVSTSVVSPSFVKIGVWLYEKCKKSKMPYSAMVKEMEQWSRIHMQIHDLQIWFSGLCMAARLMALHRLMSQVLPFDEWIREPR